MKIKVLACLKHPRKFQPVSYPSFSYPNFSYSNFSYLNFSYFNFSYLNRTTAKTQKFWNPTFSYPSFSYPSFSYSSFSYPTFSYSNYSYLNRTTAQKFWNPGCATLEPSDSKSAHATTYAFAHVWPRTHHKTNAFGPPHSLGQRVR